MFEIQSHAVDVSEEWRISCNHLQNPHGYSPKVSWYKSFHLLYWLSQKFSLLHYTRTTKLCFLRPYSYCPGVLQAWMKCDSTPVNNFTAGNLNEISLQLVGPVIWLHLLISEWIATRSYRLTHGQNIQSPMSYYIYMKWHVSRSML